MAFDLNPVAVTSATRLRAIDAGRWPTRAELARAAERHPSNIARDLDRLQEQGLITADDLPALTDAGRAQLDAIARAEGGEGIRPDDLPEGIEALRHDEILPDPDNARRDWESPDAIDDLQALVADIDQNGLLQNLVVRPHPDPLDDRFILVGGERRWRAIGCLIQSGRWPADRLIPARRLTTDDVGVRLAALAENLQRRALNPIEEANAYRGLREVGLSTEAIASRVAMTQRHVQARLQLLELTEDQQRRMTLPADDPERLSVSEARRLVANLEAKQKLRTRWEAELSPRARLILAELRLAAKNGYIYDQVEVAADAMNADDDAIALNKAGLVHIPTQRRIDGRTWARCEGAAWDVCNALFPDGPAAYAEALRRELDLPDPAEGTLSISWLNGPFEIPAEVQAQIEAAQAEREKTNENYRLENERRAAERQARAERLSLTRVHADALLAKAAETPAAPVLDGVEVIANGLGQPLPWRVTSDGDVEDREGNEVWFGGGGEDAMISSMLIVAAVNAAAGLATPPIRVIADEDDAQPERTDEDGEGEE